jgi:hypothetical protein
MKHHLQRFHRKKDDNQKSPLSDVWASTKKHQHITPILVSLHWLPVHYRCQYKVLMYVFKLLHGSAPVYLQELDSVYQPTRSYIVFRSLTEK